MKTTLKTNKAILFTAMIWMMASVAMAQEVRIGSGAGGKVGSGAGGKNQLLSQSSINGDVEVPYPGEQPENTVIVYGEPGPGQPEKYSVCTYKENSGKPVAFSDECVSQKLNEAVVVVDETAINVFYSNTMIFDRKIKGQQLAIQLRKIKVPKSRVGITFDVFRDLTHRQEQEKLFLAGFIASKNEEYYQKLKGSNISQASDIIRAVETGDYILWGNIGDRFNHRAEWITLGYEGNWIERGRFMVTDPKDGEFVSVLPGIYGIVWKTADGTAMSTTYGIRVD